MEYFKKLKGCFLLLCLVMLALTLTGCCIQHEWTEATCTTSRICTKCGKEEGEPLGHNWIEATCTEAKKCDNCGMTEGESLGHEYPSQNFVCTRCDEEKVFESFEELKSEAEKDYEAFNKKYEGKEMLIWVQVYSNDHKNNLGEEDMFRDTSYCFFYYDRSDKKLYSIKSGDKIAVRAQFWFAAKTTIGPSFVFKNATLEYTRA